MKPIRIFRHVANEGPGYLANYLERRQIPIELVCIDKGEAVPPQIDDVSALVFMGGPMSVNDDLPWIEQEIDLIRRAEADKMPILGHCLGSQLIAKALGSDVQPMAEKEIGWHTLHRIQTPAADDWLCALPHHFPAFHWHGETFNLPPGAWHLLRSDLCKNQAFVSGNCLGLQFHLEMTEALVQDWADVYQDELPDEDVPEGAGVQSARQMTEDLEDRVTVLNNAAEKLYERWLKPALER